MESAWRVIFTLTTSWALNIRITNKFVDKNNNIPLNFQKRKIKMLAF